mgnify:FL=1
MAIPEEIQKKANDIRTKVYGREVRESLARGIEVAGDIADNADTKSTDAVDQVNNIQGQVDQLVIEGDSSVEAAQARVNLRGETFETLKRRIDNLDEEFTQRAVNVKWFGASGSEQQTIGSIAMGSNQLTVLNSIDFKPGQGISIEGAGEDGRV